MPSLALRDLIPLRPNSLPEPLERDGVSFWVSARAAIWQAISALGLEAGQTVALPAFCCGSEIEPFVHAGLRPHFFGVTPDLDPDPKSFRRAAEGAAAALVTHYFGFPANLDHAVSVCRERGVALIEDCAHALYATRDDRPVGTRGHAAVFSFWKTVAMPDGGALLLQEPVPRTVAVAPTYNDVLLHTRHIVARGLRSHPLGLVRLAEAARACVKGGSVARKNGAGAPEVDAEYELIRFRPERAATGMSGYATRLFRSANHDEIKRRRRDRYRQIGGAIQGLPGLEPLFESLRLGACPLYFPVVVEDAASLRRALAGRRIGTKYVWPWFHPAVPWDRFQMERNLKLNILGFPVHQSLRDDEVNRLIEAVRAWAKS